MSLLDPIFVQRVSLLLGLLAAAVVADFLIYRRQAMRWKEYSFLLLAALLGGLVGLANDAMTSTLSPEYFIFGKGLINGPELHQRSMALGFQAGVCAAMIAAAFYLFANSAKPSLPALSFTRLWWFVLRPLVVAFICAVVFSTVALFMKQPLIDFHISYLMPAEAVLRFWRVWCIHLGLYTGLLVGTIWAVVGIRRARRTLTTSSSAS